MALNPKKTREQRRAERLERLANYQAMRVRSEARGWQIKASAGMPVWQFIPGGQFQPISS